uniref:NAD-dependent epimerase/dehydratase family protein n=1 Tax=Bosea sp. NBC_00436 TaxID=2969620 RepID=A0A9E7ZTZ8_9HYPH
MRKAALVFGGAGFIGSHLLRFLSETGEYDALVCADIAPTPRFETKGVTYVSCDVTKSIPADICPGATEIYNLAAVHTTPGHEEWEYYWANVLGAANICAFATKQEVETIVFTSSIAVYGATEQPLDELTQPEPESAYGRSKLQAEIIHRTWRAEQPDRRRLVVARPAVIYGYQERGNFTRLAGLLERGRFVFPGRKDTIKSCGYVKDLVASLRFMLARDEAEVTYNFAHRERYSSQDICDAFSEVAGFAPARLVVPMPVMTLGGLAFEGLNGLGYRTSINRARVMKLPRLA